MKGLLDAKNRLINLGFLLIYRLTIADLGGGIYGLATDNPLVSAW